MGVVSDGLDRAAKDRVFAASIAIYETDRAEARARDDYFDRFDEATLLTWEQKLLDQQEAQRAHRAAVGECLEVRDPRGGSDRRVR